VRVTDDVQHGKVVIGCGQGQYCLSAELVLVSDSRREVQGCPSPASDPDNADGKQGRSKLASEGLTGFGCLASSLDVRDAVAVKGDRSGQDDKKHD